MEMSVHVGPSIGNSLMRGSLSVFLSVISVGGGHLLSQKTLCYFCKEQC